MTEESLGRYPSGRLPPLGKEAPTHEEFRAVGFTGAAAEFPRDDLALAMFAAFNNVTVAQLPHPFHYFPNPATREAWNRVAVAAARHLTTNATLENAAMRAELLRTADEVEGWAYESRMGGWSTHQCKPNLVVAARLRDTAGDESQLCPDCSRPKARTSDAAAIGHCPKWWAVNDKMADEDCRKHAAPPPLPPMHIATVTPYVEDGKTKFSVTTVVPPGPSCPKCGARDPAYISTCWAGENCPMRQAEAMPGEHQEVLDAIKGGEEE